MAEWAHLREEMVRLIALKLFPKDVQSCSLVCRAWRAALADCPYRWSPCLMLRTKGMWQLHQHNRSLVLDVNLPRLDKARILSFNRGWLLMQSKSQTRSRGGLFFFNPFNERTVEIKQKTPSYLAFHLFNPPTSPECFIVGIQNMSTGVKIGILKRGHGDVWPAWDAGRIYATEEVSVELSRPVLRGGFLYFVNMQGNVSTLDVHHHSSWTSYSKCLPFRRLRNKITKCFLFQFKGDEAMHAVFLIHDVGTVNVFRLSDSEMKWESVKDLGNKMVYLSTTSCFGDTAHSQGMANKIFFPKFHNDDILCYCLATRKYHSLDGNYSHDYDFNGSDLHKFDENITGGRRVAWIPPAPPDTHGFEITRDKDETAIIAWLLLIAHTIRIVVRLVKKAIKLVGARRNNTITI